MKYIFTLFALLYSTLSPSSQIDKNLIKTLSESEQWRKLLHYHKSSLLNYQSEVDDPDFFLSPEGKYSLQKELKATLNSFKHNPKTACQYPARYLWLSEQLNWNSDFGSLMNQCKKLKAWFNTINPQSASVIFPASYMNSPSSMFGHLFIRIDSNAQRNDLLAHSINFGANVDNEDGSLTYMFKGLFGGYPGVVSIVPYYEKVKEYSDIENRDIWEYSLNLSQKEIYRLILHVWELKQIHFDYYFIDENCAYRILALLEVARPELDLLSSFYGRAIPADVIKAINQVDLVNKINYRPSLATDLANKIKQLSNQEKVWVIKFFSNPDFSDTDEFKQLLPSQKAAILEVTTQWIRYKLSDMPSDKSHAREGYKLLLKRSKLPEESPLKKVPKPKVRDDQGHNTLRMSFGLKQRDEKSLALFSIRSAYHSLDDPSPGYLNGAQIEFFNLQASINDNKSLKLEKLTLLNLMSLSPRNDFFKPLSWNIDIGSERFTFSSDKSELFNHIQGGAGFTYGNEINRTYFLLGGQIFNNEQSISTTYFQWSVKAGWLINYDLTQLLLEFNSHNDLSNDSFDINNFRLSYTKNISKDQSFNVQLVRERVVDKYNSNINVVYHYFL
ncbi:DUF4105 domain-containing protein [Pleionea sediminis]|uniref:Lnb N-terminal periplasmic domain-containing protein n=1 Tax=Pleionea sediminis TaxID=2569479 RepID=UPI001184BAF8|nr:DUF4105 domain-containing protein [Pleionea sediminis]